MVESRTARIPGGLSSAHAVLGLPLCRPVARFPTTPESDERRHGVVGSEAEIALCPKRYNRSQPAPPSRARLGSMARPARDISGWNRWPREVHCRLPVGSGAPRAWTWTAAPVSGRCRFISELIDTLPSGYNIDLPVYATTFQWRSMAFFCLHAVRSDRGRGDGGKLLTALELVYGPSTGADDRISWDI